MQVLNSLRIGKLAQMTDMLAAQVIPSWIIEEAVRRLSISFVKGLNFVVRRISAFTHFVQFALQWGFHPRPEWFDHYLDQHWQFSAKNNGLWVERGVFSRMVLKPDAKMLDICCGDGFNARHFYSSKAASIMAIDFDKDAIPHAIRFNSMPKHHLRAEGNSRRAAVRSLRQYRVGCRD